MRKHLATSVPSSSSPAPSHIPSTSAASLKFHVFPAWKDLKELDEDTRRVFEDIEEAQAEVKRKHGSASVSSLRQLSPNDMDNDFLQSPPRAPIQAGKRSLRYYGSSSSVAVDIAGALGTSSSSAAASIGGSTSPPLSLAPRRHLHHRARSEYSTRDIEFRIRDDAVASAARMPNPPPISATFHHHHRSRSQADHQFVSRIPGSAFDSRLLLEPDIPSQGTLSGIQAHGNHEEFFNGHRRQVERLSEQAYTHSVTDIATDIHQPRNRDQLLRSTSQRLSFSSSTSVGDIEIEQGHSTSILSAHSDDDAREPDSGADMFDIRVVPHAHQIASEDESERLARQLMEEEEASLLERMQQVQQQALQRLRRFQSSSGNAISAPDAIDADESMQDVHENLDAILGVSADVDAGDEDIDGDAEVDPDQMTYDQLLELGTQLGDVKQERWRVQGRSIVDSLPVVKFSKGILDNAFKDEMCLICQYRFENGEEVKILPCNHGFHKDCVDPWLKDHCTCVTCKRSIDSSERQEMQAN